MFSVIQLVCLLALCFISVSGFLVTLPSTISSTTSQRQLARSLRAEEGGEATKGFGKKVAKVVKEKTKGAIEREKASESYDNLAASGVPEYNIWVKPKGKGEEDWIPAGTMAVPRTEKLANAVFEQQEPLVKSVVRLFPKLADTELDYGYNLKVYPDEPVKPLELKPRSEDTIKNWFEGLLSPINASGNKPK